ncbi:DUF1499 domain-containing protein [Neorhodopirellula pilleata]|uniref:DUF1499 domain-containing protein n=1 Tax=Neorhodopirellula pilleata TaxID=2714738 RepID=A0A5C6A1G2_9BACT|nr:DUF1499 domain-containing protein [Neorhodopirellula pilleata]TWT93150.1 hypothetical protein Pla100_44670 [Neorhodopirellula pilleata]
MLGYLAAGIGIAMIGKTLWMIDDWSRDWSSNQASLSSGHPDPDLRLLEIQRPLEDVEQAIIDWAGGESNWAVEPPSDSEATNQADPSMNSLRRLHLTHSTSVFRFVDDVHVELQQQTTGSGDVQTLLHAGSRSRIGKGDLGQNPRNLKMLRRGIKQKLGLGG